MSAPCPTIETDQLAGLIDGEGPVDADLRAHVAACAICQQRVADYRRITGALEVLGSDRKRPADALERALREADSQRPARRAWAVGAAVTAIAAVAIGLVVLRDRGQAPLGEGELRVERIERAGRSALRGEAVHVGERLRASFGGGDAAIWIYYNDRLRLACPSACSARTAAAVEVEFEIDAPGRYQVLAIAAGQKNPAPPPPQLEEAVARAVERGVAHELREFRAR